MDRCQQRTGFFFYFSLKGSFALLKIKVPMGGGGGGRGGGGVPQQSHIITILGSPKNLLVNSY